MGIDPLSEEATLSKLFCLPSEKGSILKGKNLLLSLLKSIRSKRKDSLPRVANSTFRVDPFQKGNGVQEVTNVVSHVKIPKIYQMYHNP